MQLRVRFRFANRFKYLPSLRLSFQLDWLLWLSCKANVKKSRLTLLDSGVSPDVQAMPPDFADRVAKADKLKPIAENLNHLAQLSFAWSVTNENVSTVMIGVKTVEQLEQNLSALGAIDKITPTKADLG